jgi:mannose-6-phosphate isomerase-like protein (cupin superfamily)
MKKPPRSKIVRKGWGHEQIWASNPLYAAKFLVFKEHGQSSYHFHKYKHETWYVMEGIFRLERKDLTNAEDVVRELHPTDIVEIPPMVPHRLTCLTMKYGRILEVSSPDSVDDNYRIEPGDSQKRKK